MKTFLKLAACMLLATMVTSCAVLYPTNSRNKKSVTYVQPKQKKEKVKKRSTKSKKESNSSSSYNDKDNSR